MRHPYALAAVAATAALLIAGCGSSNSNSASGGAASTSAVTQAAASSTAGSTTTGAAASGAAVVSVKHSKYGTILAGGPKRLTVYLFEADKGSSSSCTGECAKDWPPLTTSGAPTAVGGAVTADLGTTTRADGTTQVTYKGHPLYFFERDTKSDDAYGQGVKAFGAEWYVLAPSGAKVEDNGSSDDGSASGAGAQSSGSSGSSSMGASEY